MNPIGIFDSGLGGLSVWQELIKIMPNESFIYLADSAHCPYGSKTHEEIRELAVKNTEFLISQGVKMIVVACNTATAAAIEFLRNKYKIPFIGMEPAIKPAALLSKTGCVGVLATAGTFEGRLFKETSQKYAKGVKVITIIGNGLVELVENNKSNSKEAEKLLKTYLNPMINCSADYIVLGCTHYPFLEKTINKITNNSIKLLNPAPAVARRTKEMIKTLNLENNSIKPVYKFYSSGDLEKMQEFLFDISGINYKVESKLNN